MSEIDLSNDWKLVWDTEDNGVISRIFTEIPKKKTEKVNVPHFWDENAHSSAFYYKVISLSAKDKRCVLRFEQVSFYAIIWVNGKLVEEHFGPSTAFELDISQFIKAGTDNLICLKVSKPSVNNDFMLVNNEEPIQAEQLPQSLPWKRYPIAGITGKVSMVTGERALLTGLEIASNVDREQISVKVSFNNPRNYVAKLNIFARNPKLEISTLQKEVKLERENASIILQFKFKDIKLWSLDNPNVYMLEINLEDSNSLKSNFGFKKFDCKQGDYYLNDAIIKIQGIVYSWRRDVSIEKELKSIKGLGFNAIRTGGAPFSRETLNICDKLGLLVFQEFPICDEASSKIGLEAAKVVAAEVVKEGSSNPSLAMWVLGSDNGRLILENGAKLLNEIDSLDSYHPAISNINNVFIDNERNFKCGNEKIICTTGKIIGITDANINPYSSHNLALKIFGSVPFTVFLSRYGIPEDEDFIIPDQFFGDSWFQDSYKQFTDEVKKIGKVLLTIKNYNLLGNVKNNEEQHNTTHIIKKFVDKKAKNIFTNASSFIKKSNEFALSGLSQNIQSLQSSPIVSGYFIEEWADFKNNFTGIVNENGESKHIEQNIKHLTAATKLLISGLERIITPSEGISFQLSVLNEKRLNEINISAQILDENNKIVHEQNKNYTIPKLSLASIGDLSIKAPQKTGSYTLKLILSDLSKELYALEEPIEIIDNFDIKNALAKTEFLDSAENSAEIAKMIKSKKTILFTTALSSLVDSFLEDATSAIKEGKILFVSDLVPEDIKLLNDSKLFDFSLESFYSSGANGIAMHYIPENSPFDKETCFSKSILDKTCSAIMPVISMYEIKGAKSFISSVSLKNDKLQEGVDLQVIEYGKGKIIFSTLNFEGLETYSLTNKIFAKIIKNVTE